MSASAPVMTQPSTPRRALHQLTGKPATAADRLLALAAGVRWQGVERSCKLSSGKLADQRVLFGKASSELADTSWAQADRLLGLPESTRIQYAADWQAAHFAYFGFEGGKDALSYRIYLEFPVNLARQHDPASGSFRPVLLARGYKWDALTTAAGQATLTEYWWTPRLTADQIDHRIDRTWLATAPPADSPSQADAREALRCVRRVLKCATDLARTRSNPLDWTYLDVREPGNARHSFDLNLYAADLQVRDVVPALRDAAAAFGVGPGHLDGFLTWAEPASLGHLSGGFDREAQPFLTLYFDEG